MVNVDVRRGVYMREPEEEECPNDPEKK